MDIWVSTSNSGKLNEYRNILEPKGFKIFSPADLNVFTMPPEDGDSFEANARIKAKAMKAVQPGHWVIGEDSGLEVDGLNGLPGIHSARYAGEKAQDSENVAKLLKMMSIRCGSNRKAQFVCTLVVYDPDGNEHVITGDLKGTIAAKQMGTGGFGYDPVFIPDSYEKTLAEMERSEKNKISHRAQAAKSLLSLMQGEQ